MGRVLCLCLWTLTAFWLGNIGVPPRFSSQLIFPFLLIGCLFLWRERAVFLENLGEKKRAILVGEGLFFGVFIFFLVLRSFGPETADGEKPMDMAIIAAVARADYLPPPNPYTSGERLVAYYYSGHLQTALATTAISSSPQWTYNLMCATIPALVFSSLFMLCAALCKSLKLGFFAVCGVLCLGTLAPLREFWPGVFGSAPEGPAYFATSRVIPFTINEYPFFTFAFGDLHAHLFAMPLAVLVLCLAWALWQGGRNVSLVLCGLALGALAMTNTWDFPLFTLLGAFAVWHGRGMWREKVGGVVAMVCLALLAASIFLFKLKTTSSGVHFLWPSSPLIAWLLVWGVFLSVLIPGLMYVKTSSESAFCRALVLCGILALAWSEFTWMGYWGPPYHRQDTVFKFGLQAWYFCGVAAFCLALPQIATRRWPRFLPFVFLPFLAIMLYSSMLVVWGRAGEFRAFKGLNAWAQLPENEQNAARWLQTRARDGDFLIEAEQYEGGDYTEYSRYANATGIPAVIGPQSHSLQWLGKEKEILQRKLDVRMFYTTGDVTKRSAILRKYRVRWIVCGELERRQYGEAFVNRVAGAFPIGAHFGEISAADSVIICENPFAL